jgi:hypothetical protein
MLAAVLLHVILAPLPIEFDFHFAASRQRARDSVFDDSFLGLSVESILLSIHN